MRFALARLGAILVPVNFMLKADEVAYILRHAQAQMLATDSGLAELARAAAALDTYIQDWRPPSTSRLLFLTEAGQPFTYHGFLHVFTRLGARLAKAGVPTIENVGADVDAVTGKLRASGPLVSANGAFFAEAITTLANVAAAAINATGPITGVSVSLSGELTAPTASVGSIAAASEVVSGLLTAGSNTLAAPGTAGQVLTNVGGVFVPSTPFAPPATTMSIVTGARSFNTVYHNTSGYRLTVSASASISSGVANGVDCYGNVASTSAALPASGAGAQTVAANSVTNSTGQTGVTFVVPPGYYYNFTWDDIPGSSPVPTLTYWTEWVN